VGSRFKREGSPGYYNFQGELLTGVILGALIQPKDREKVSHWIECFPNRVNVFQAKISRAKYELDIEQVQ
jgi:hypothetical protein